MHLWTAEAGDPAERVGLGWIELRERAVRGDRRGSTTSAVDAEPPGPGAWDGR